jgi:hypothetical protein
VPVTISDDERLTPNQRQFIQELSALLDQLNPPQLDVSYKWDHIHFYGEPDPPLEAGIPFLRAMMLEESRSRSTLDFC